MGFSESSTTGWLGIETRQWLACITLTVSLLGIAAASILIVYAQTELGSNAITFHRLGLAAIAFGIWHLKNRYRDRLTSHPVKSPTWQVRDRGLLWLAGISFSASLIIWAWSMTQTSVANATLLENLMPLFTALGGWLFLQQQFSGKFLVGMGVAISGAIAIGVGDLGIAANSPVGDLAALLSASFAAATLLSLEQLQARFSAVLVMFWVCSIGAGFAFIAMLLTESQWLPPSWVSGLAVISLALISQFLGQGLLTVSLSYFSSAFLAIALLTTPVIAAFLAWILLGENLTWGNLGAFGVVLVGVYLALSAPSTQEQAIAAVPEPNLSSLEKTNYAHRQES